MSPPQLPAESPPAQGLSHRPERPAKSRRGPRPKHPAYIRCSETTSAGTPCRCWAVRGTDPPRCAPHGGGRWPVGPPKGSQNRLKHGFYIRPVGDLTSLDDIIEDLAIRQARLSAYIDSQGEDVSVDEIVQLLRLHGQNASRLERLLRAKRALSGEAADGLSGAIAQVLDELSAELGVEL